MWLLCLWLYLQSMILETTKKSNYSKMLLSALECSLGKMSKWHTYSLLNNHMKWISSIKMNFKKAMDKIFNQNVSSSHNIALKWFNFINPRFGLAFGNIAIAWYQFIGDQSI